MRVRSRYVIRGKEWRIAWHSFTTKKAFIGDIDWNLYEIRLDARLKNHEDDEVLEGILRHELLHALLEKKSDAGKPHFLWTFKHDYLAGITMKLDRLLRTGKDV